MSRTALLPFGVTKEFRGLAGTGLACLVALLVPAVSGVGAFRRLAIPAYFLGAAALGALSIGHEYSHRTLALLLSQPARRERLLLVKLGVLAAMLLALSAVASAVVDFRATESERLAFAVLPVLCGLFVAPWLTMLCRSPIAGAVFTIPLPGWLLIVSQLVYVVAYGRGPSADFQMAVLWRGTLGLCAVGAVMTWRMFMRLEAIDGGGREVHLPRWLRRRGTTSIGASAPTKRHPVWLLVKKELWLQQTAMAVAGLHLAGALTLVSLSDRVPDLDDVVTALTLLHGALISILIGSLASAGERQLGTLEWQVLLPVATWKQWAVKVGTALGLALLLALGLPELLASIHPALLDTAPFFQPQFAVGVAVLTVVSLYVSSLCTSGLRALLMSVPAIVAVVLPISMVAESLTSSGLVMAARLSSEKAWQRFGISPVDRSRLMGTLALLLVAAILAVVLRFALANHRSAEPAGGRLSMQVAVMAIGLSAGALLLAGMAALS